MNNKTPDEIIEALERLQRLKDSGLLSDEEVAQQKAEILANQKAASGRAPNPADILSVRPETLKKISESQRSGGGRGALSVILAIIVLGVGGYFGAQALNIRIPGLPIVGPPEPKLTASISGGTISIESKSPQISITDVTVNQGQCLITNPTTSQHEKAKSTEPNVAAFKAAGLTAHQYCLWNYGRTVDFPINLKMGDRISLKYYKEGENGGFIGQKSPGGGGMLWCPANCNIVEVDIESDGWTTHFDF